MSFQKLERQLVEARKGCIELAQAKADMPLHHSLSCQKLRPLSLQKLSSSKLVEAVLQRASCSTWFCHLKHESGAGVRHVTLPFFPKL